MEYPILNRTAFLIERADLPRAVPPQNPAEQLLAAASDIITEQRTLSTLLAYSLLSGLSEAPDHTLKLSCR